MSATRMLILGIVLVTLLGTAAPAPGAAVPQPTASLECLPDELLVKFGPGADPLIVSARHGATVSSVIPGIEVYVLAIPPGTVAEKVAEFQADPEVQFAEPNGTMRIPESPPSSPESCPSPDP